MISFLNVAFFVCFLGFVCDKVVGYCVQPDDGTSHQECHNLSYYMNHPSVLHNNSYFCFISGVYQLPGVWNISNISNLSLVSPCGSGSLSLYSPSANITCGKNQSGMIIKDVKNITIIGLKFIDCGHTGVHHPKLTLVSSGLILINVQNLNMSGVIIENTRGRGMYCYSLEGSSNISNTEFIGGHNISNHRGGNLRLNYGQSNFVKTSITIRNTTIRDGYENVSDHFNYAGGLDIYFDTNNSVIVILDNVTLRNNTGYDGGNIAISYTTYSKWWKSRIEIKNSHILNGTSFNFGGGIFMEAIQHNVTSSNKSNSSNSEQVILSVSNTHFINNTAHHAGGGVYLQIHESQNLTSTAKILFSSCYFTNNTIRGPQSGTALHVVNFHLPGYLRHKIPEYIVTVDGCVFHENGLHNNMLNSLGCGTMYIAENKRTEIANTSFTNNYCSGIAAIQSNMVLKEQIVISNNRGYNGGGLMLCDSSLFFLTSTANVTIENNHARNFGGGIYAEFECAQEIPPCFFGTKENRTSVFLLNNTATAGEALFGGNIKSCYLLPDSYQLEHSWGVFNNTFKLIPDLKGEKSAISSDPYKVCFCLNHKMFDHTSCTTTHTYIGPEFYPGMQITVAVVIVGQLNGLVPGVVQASITNGYNISDKSKSTAVYTECKNLTFIITLFKSENTARSNLVNLNLSVEDALFRTRSPNQLYNSTITINIQNKCPNGFNLNDEKTYCVCSKNLSNALDIQRSDCDINTTTISRNESVNWWIGFNDQKSDCDINTNTVARNESVNWWIGFNDNHSISYSPYCPFDFCHNTKEINIEFYDGSSGDQQCSFGRTGRLCGGCPHNHSHMLGSSLCKICENNSGKAIGKTIMFAVLGILLLVFLCVLNLNVTEGALGPIIFYMNIVRINSSIYFGLCEGAISCVSHRVEFLRQFVAWMNLDLGVGTCYYNGMSALGKTGLQFVFPLYLWCLCAAYIYLNRRISILSRIAGKQSVRLLATVILLSYAKLLRTIIDILWPVKVFTLCEGSHTPRHKLVWKMDGTKEYFKDGHRILCILAGIVGLLTLPYTLSLLLIQLLKRLSHYRVLCWVVKLKPFFDAYTGPYKDKYQFWTGFLLAIRIGVYVAIANNTTKGPVLNLSIVGATAVILLLLSKNGAYKSAKLSMLESFVYVNLILFSIVTAFQFQQKSAKQSSYYIYFDNNNAIILFVGSMLVLFCGVVVSNSLKIISSTKYWGRFKIWARERFWYVKIRKPIKSLVLHHSLSDSESSSSSDEMDPLRNAPLPARYDQLREPLVETN